jgi:hypothetical protein
MPFRSQCGRRSSFRVHVVRAAGVVVVPIVPKIIILDDEWRSIPPMGRLIKSNIAIIIHSLHTRRLGNDFVQTFLNRVAALCRGARWCVGEDEDMVRKQNENQASQQPKPHTLVGIRTASSPIRIVSLMSKWRIKCLVTGRPPADILIVALALPKHKMTHQTCRLSLMQQTTEVVGLRGESLARERGSDVRIFRKCERSAHKHQQRID